MAAPAACASPPWSGVVRVDQVGYAPGETKIAVLLAPGSAAGARAAVIDAGGRTVLSPALGGSRGRWNGGFRDVRPIDLTALTTPGVYRVRIDGPGHAESPPFRIGAGLFAPLARDAVGYLQAHRDGPDQVSPRRSPSHLADGAATVYAGPSFDDDDQMTDDLESIGGPVDVAGGWFDAGDYLKFTHTTAYVLVVLLLVKRDGVDVPGLDDEIRHGLAWLDKMTGDTFYTQVGIGSGGPGFRGDHDAWRLPEQDDRLDVSPGDERYYQRYRPVFRAAPLGEPISPNLAGRVAAAYALAAQVDPAHAAARLATAARIFDRADTDPGKLVTTEPRSFYPEDSWADDLALGAAELARAGRQLGDARADEWSRSAVSWGETNAEIGRTATLSVYDVSALADLELATSAPAFRRDLERRLDAGVAAAAADPMRAAAGDGGPDYAARQLGFSAMASLYRRAFGDNRYAAFATTQRGVVLGANGWGVSLVVGAGTTYPRSPHDQIATLTPGVLAGAVVNGPNDATRVEDLLTGDPSSSFTDFDRPDAMYVDDLRISATNEPSIDFTATGLLAFVLLGAQT